ncbi:MAG: serine hydrolase domain-containing protein [Myxococcota bacterium]
MTRNVGIGWLVALSWATAPVACAPKVDPAPVQRPMADVEHRLASGARFTVAPGWVVHPEADGVRVVGPEGRLEVHLVEAPAADIAAAWTARRPGFDRATASTTESAGRNGWASERSIRYSTSPDENRWIEGRASTVDDIGVVVLFDLPADHAQRRRSELQVLLNSVTAPGFTPERYTGRTPRPLDAERLDAVRAWVREAQTAADIPGVAVALFDREAVLMAEGFGVRESGGDEPVTADTPFLIASNTKALTTLLLAKLTDEGQFGWDTPVTDVYPPFRLGDAATTARVDVRHLVCACTGLPRLDSAWLFTYHDATPAQAVGELAGMQPTTAFGELYQYSNPLAAAAGYVGAHAAFPDLELGAAYDRAMQTLIFDPLQMADTTFDFDVAEAAGAAVPHAWNADLVNVPITHGLNRNVRPARPAGGAWSTVRDYARIGQLELARGVLPDGTRYIGEAAIQERHRPQVRIDRGSWYGMGLVITDVKGVQVVSHGGSLIGFKSNFFLIPEAGIGGVVFANADIGWTLTSRLSGHVLELLYADDTPEALSEARARTVETRSAYAEERAAWQIPADASLAGMLARRYRSDELGDVVVERVDGRLRFVMEAWSTEVGTKRNPDGTVSFVILEPGLLGFEFVGAESEGAFASLSLHDPQHTYVFVVADEVP